MSYLTDHPTNWNWAPFVHARVKRALKAHPNATANTYWDHPPDTQVPRRWPVDYYSRYSADFWGPGGRGDPINKQVGDRLYDSLFNSPGPKIDWIIWQGRMWWRPATGGHGYQPAPWGPAGSDAQHMEHIHVTFTFSGSSWV